MQYTDNYGLKKPRRGVDRANVDDLDDNFDIIDGALADDRQISLLMYDSTSTYNTGDIVGYENPTTHRIRAFRCLEDNVTGPWDGTKWAQTTLADEIGTGGGASSLADLTDTAITSPTNGQTLVYNSTSGKWENASGGAVSDLDDLGDVDITTPSDGDLLTYDSQNDEWVNAPASIPDLGDLGDVTLTTPSDGQALTYDDGEWVNTDLPAVTKTATGNPIEITDGASAPMVKCVTAITGSQDLHGYDKPWVGGAGKNKLPMTLSDIKALNTAGTWSGDTYNLNSVSFEVQTNNSGAITGIKVNGTASAITALTTSEYNMSAGTYVYSGCPSGGSTTSYYQDWRSELGGQLVDNGNGSSYTFPSASGAKRTRIVIYEGCVTSNLMFYPMIRLSTESDSTFTPYSNICPITAYDSCSVTVADDDTDPTTSTTHTTTFPSAIYRGSEDCVNGTVVAEWGMIASYAGEVLPGEWISDRDEYAPGTTPTTGAQVAYELATPTTSPVTVTNLPIRTLSGYNHIESTTGSLDLEYITQSQQAIVDLIESSQHVYSTQEQIVGTWIDGSPIYEKTVNFTAPSNSYTTETTGITDFDKCVGYSGIVMLGSGIFEDINYNRPDSGNSTYYIAVTADGDIFIRTYEAVTATVYITLRYTKTASQSRSAENLSKGGEVVDKVDKVDKVDEEKKVDEPLDEKVDVQQEELTKEPVEQPSEPQEEPLEEETEDLPTEEEEPEIEGVEEPEEEQEEPDER